MIYLALFASYVVAILSQPFSNEPSCDPQGQYEDGKVKDEILNLPGWESELPSKQYSGFLEIPNTSPKRYYHYWFVESQSNPLSDPFVVWYNGGPGASSLTGYFTEMGAFHLNDYSLIHNISGIPQLWYNNYTWSQFANMLYIESPAAVGYSHCTNGIDPYTLCPQYNDSFTAKDNYESLKQFFKYYSEYLNNSLYITGESYAGVYIPTLVDEIENNNNNGLPPLKGFAIGNGCMGIGGQGGCDNDEIANALTFMYGHGQISTELYNRANNICGNSIYYGNWTNSVECESIILYGLEKIGGYYVYDLYDPCWEKNYTYPYINSDQLKANVNYNTQYSCGNNVYYQYLNIDKVKQAINIPKELKWKFHNQVEFDYVKTRTDLRPWYVNKIKEGKYNILIYNGDVDTSVATIGANRWTYNLGFNVYENEEWRPWTVDGKMDMAGYVTIFNTTRNFTFVTIRGAGHMTAQYKPKQSFAMIKNFIQDTPFPRFISGGTVQTLV